MVRGVWMPCRKINYLVLQNLMRRFFFRPEDKIGEIVVLSEGESHHIRIVLRLPAGTHVDLMDGIGGVHRAELLECAGPVRARIISSSLDGEGDRIALQVCQGMLKGKNMDTVVQKCTELGVHCLIPLMTDRCQGRPDLIRDRKKHGRWQRIVDEACKQCGRSRPMELLETADFQDVIKSSGSDGLRILFWEKERDVHLQDLLPFQGVDRVSILLGPEGGFTREEAAMAKNAGWRSVSLGPRILRAETATFASIAILQHHLGAL
jgi:16S rRNA (uracil1498-N3)-methyltransferase